MNNNKPKNIGEYKRWLKVKHNIRINDKAVQYYETVTTRIKRDIENSEFWIQLTTDKMNKYKYEYLTKNHYPLLIGEFKPELLIKPFSSILEKTFRKNIIYNNNWPDEPENGWIHPENWFSTINDIVRTLFVVKYLDAVDFLSKKIQSCCDEFNLHCNEISFEAKDVGYYAAHLYSKQEFEILTTTWNTERIIVSIEIQITTQLQDVIRKLLHKYYEKNRVTIKDINKEDIPWQWNYKSDEFATNYLGHMLHYLEGKIVEIIEKQKGEN